MINVNSGVIRTVCRGVGKRLFSDVGWIVESCNNWEVWLKVGGVIGSRDGRSVGKDIKYGVNVRIDDSVGWGVDRGFYDG